MTGDARTGLLLALAGAVALFAFSRTKEGEAMTAKIVDAAAGVLTPRGIRNNNPGNIVRTADQWKGMSADQSADGRFVVFDAPVWGLRAMARILRKYVGSGATSVREIIARWAPSTENDTDSYVQAVARAVGIDPDAIIDLDASLVPLMAAIVHHENGMQPYAPAMFEEAVRLERSA